ncbi:LysR family transcriptional regulator [Alteromonadaceae bacterium M269]|nr:LysR family transcriptional regulator [Alteromonadaceae bacterium M269]
MLDRTHLKIIQAIQQYGTLTKSAEALHLTQSALSHAIKKLDAELGVPMWEKEGRQLRLTQAGKRLSSLANRVLPQFEHCESQITDIAKGRRGTLRIGMECHPCYQWLLKVIEPFLREWPDVDIDVKQEFQFGGLGALLGYEIDLLVTPDPLFRRGLEYVPVFDYEHVLVVNSDHHLASVEYAKPSDIGRDVLITYPVEASRLDIFSQFLLPAGCSVKQHRTLETTEIMLHMVAAGRGVGALPKWLVEEYSDHLDLIPVRLGKKGMFKQIFMGIREEDQAIDYVAEFINTAQL